MKKQHLDWVLALKKRVNSNSHAMGIMVLEKFYYYEPNDYKYRNGDFMEYEDSFVKMWRMEDLNLQWNELDQPYIPTLKDKLKKTIPRQRLSADGQSSTKGQLACYSCL